eukprot:1155920-Pelagomonas_calceolata.AAC.4
MTTKLYVGECLLCAKSVPVLVLGRRPFPVSPLISASPPSRPCLAAWAASAWPWCSITAAGACGG